MSEVIERKPYFLEFPECVFPEYTAKASDFAIVYALYHSKRDSVCGQYPAFDVERFKSIHCKGAIYAAVSLIFNTDLGENRVPLYFYLENHIYDVAMEVFEKYEVSRDMIRRYSVADVASPDIFNANLGKKYGWITDESLRKYKNVVFFDNDVLAIGKRQIGLYDTFNSQPLKLMPATVSSRLVYRSYADWVRRIAEAAGMQPVSDTLVGREMDAFEKLGLNYPYIESEPHAIEPRHYTYSPIVSLPMRHGIVKYITKNMATCFEDEAMLSAFAMCVCPFYELSALMPRWFDMESDFIENYNSLEGAMAHIHVDDGVTESRLEEYYDRLYEGLMCQTPYWRAKEMYANQ